MDKKMAVLITVTMVISVIAGIAVAKYWLNPEQPSTDECIGEWYLIDTQVAYYDIDGEPYIGTLNIVMDPIKVDKLEEGFYSVDLNGFTVVCASSYDTLITSDLDTSETAFIATRGDSMTISFIYPLTAKTMTFQRVGTEPDYIPPIQEPQASYDVAVLDAFRAVECTGTDVIDHLDRGYKLTVLLEQAPFVFYNVTCSEFSWNYVGMKVTKTDILATAQVNEYEYVEDMVHYENGIVYTTSYDGINGNEPALWCVAYGDESKEDKPYHFAGLAYEGYETSFIYDDEAIIDSKTVAVEMEVLYQVGNLLIMKTETELGDVAYWGGAVYKDDVGYSMLIQSIAGHGSETFYGVYMCSFVKDISKVRVSGALSTYTGLHAVFIQDLS